ncbi:MAG TPA: hypothetical protein VFN02_09640, partial [Ktedonobacteraceae bacterium]|nr:hypothetical protein [Ktedonobacteraceae bacterium]
MQVPFSRRLRRPWKKKGKVRGHLALRQGDCVPLHPLLNSYGQLLLFSYLSRAACGGPGKRRGCCEDTSRSGKGTA